MENIFEEDLLRPGQAVIFSQSQRNPEEMRKVKNTLKKMGVNYRVVDVEAHPHGEMIQAAMQVHSGYMSFPNVYFGRKHIGGYDDIYPYSQCPDSLT